MARTSTTALGITLLLLAAAPPEPTAAADVTVRSEGRATQTATVQYVLHSAAVGRDFLIKVTSPFNPVRRGDTRPVIYALDGGYEVAGPIGWVLGGGGGMQEAYVVSVGYLPSDYHWREHDLAFRAYRDEDDRRTVNSGALAFQSFLETELRPFIAARAPVDDRRAILFGHSEGALFAANILADRPGEYAGYIIASPSVWSDPSIVERLRQGLPKARDVKVFLAVGGAETPRMLAGAREIDDVLKASPAVTSRSEMFAGATHISYYPRLVTEAFPWMLPR